MNRLILNLAALAAAVLFGQAAKSATRAFERRAITDDLSLRAELGMIEWGDDDDDEGGGGDNAPGPVLH
jgi:hypothetical protein